MSQKQLLLISHAKLAGGNYLEHAQVAIKSFLGSIDPRKFIAFIPDAQSDPTSYTTQVKEAFKNMGYDLRSIHQVSDPLDLINNVFCEAIFIGEGNAFRLLKALREHDLLDDIKLLAERGDLKIIGAGAGLNVACPTIQTTNDMPIIKDLTNYRALGLVNYQINSDFVPSNLIPTCMGEPREDKIKQFHEECDTPVVGLPEANWIEVSGSKSILHGPKDAFIFKKGKAVKIWKRETPLEL